MNFIRKAAATASFTLFAVIGVLLFSDPEVRLLAWRVTEQPAPSPSPANTTEVAVMTWNVHGSHNPDLSEIARVILSRGTDVIGIQEIQKTQAVELEINLDDHDPSADWNMVWANTGHDPDGPLGADPSEGHAILSPYPITGKTKWNLPAKVRRTCDTWDNCDHMRILQRAVIHIPGQITYFYNTHLCSSCEYKGDEDEWEWRRRQARDVVERVAADDARVSKLSFVPIIVGDFNSDPGTTPMITMTRHFTDAWTSLHPSSGSCSEHDDAPECGRTSPADAPAIRIDYIFSKGFTQDAYAPYRDDPDFGTYSDLSDHLPVWALLSF